MLTTRPIDRIKARCITDDNGCWLFQPADSTKTWGNKYPFIKYYGKPITVHRAVWEETEGPPPPFCEIRHQPIGYKNPWTDAIKQFKCPKNCCNPDHLCLHPLDKRDGRFKNSKSTHGDEQSRYPADDLSASAPSSAPKKQPSKQSLRELLLSVGVKNPKV